MNILITGGTGFIGTSLCQKLNNSGHSLTVLTRNIKKAQKKLAAEIQLVTTFDDIAESNNIDIVINLAGEGIADKRWTAERKKIIEKSRIDLTADLIAFIRQRKHKPQLLISGSAIGYYGDGGDKVLTEFTEPTEEFSHRLCAAWESQALRAKSMDVRVCILRTGLVVGKNGGFLQKMLPAFKFGLGAQIGDGEQWMSWVHLKDYLNMIDFLIEQKEAEGIFNATAPNPVRNKEFTKTLASALRRPAFMIAPKKVLEIALGEMSHLLTTGQQVVPKRFQELDFSFEFPTLKVALEDVV